MTVGIINNQLYELKTNSPYDSFFVPFVFVSINYKIKLKIKDA